MFRRNFILILATLIFANFSNAYANEKGNGGGGVKENGVFKTFYSAGVLVKSEPEAEVPGSDIYTETIQSLLPVGDLSTKLITSALPIGERTFYRVLENQMDKKLMERLHAEYAKITNRPENNLAIFAITNPGEQVTYLMPSFYQLSKTEQAAIIFHEAYWIMYPEANYSEVVDAEMAFQEYIEKRSKGLYSKKFPRLLGKLTKSKTLALNTAWHSDVINNTSPELINSVGKISIGNLFQKKCELNASDFPWTLESSMLSISFYCKISKKDIQDIIQLSLKFPKSSFVKELIEYLADGNELLFSKSYRQEVESKYHAKTFKNIRNEFYSFQSVDLSDDGTEKALLRAEN